MLNLANGAATQTQELKTAATYFETFLKDINGSVSDTDKVQDLQTNLNTALTSMKFALKWYVNKGKLLEYVADHCKAGEKSLQDIFTDGENYFKISGVNCEDKGVPYATFSTLEYTMKTMATNGGYSHDCILNSQEKKKNVCRLVFHFITFPSRHMILIHMA